MNSKRTIGIHASLALSGMIVWIILTAVTVKNEPWDSDQFWSYGLIAMLAVNGAAAFADPRQPAVKGLVSVSLQPVAMMFAAGEIGSMFPLGLVVFGLLGLMYSIGGIVGAFVRNRFFPS